MSRTDQPAASYGFDQSAAGRPASASKSDERSVLIMSQVSNSPPPPSLAGSMRAGHATPAGGSGRRVAWRPVLLVLRDRAHDPDLIAIGIGHDREAGTPERVVRPLYQSMSGAGDALDEFVDLGPSR